MQRSFDLIGRKKPEADALGVSNYVKPFVLELADRGRVRRLNEPDGRL